MKRYNSLYTEKGHNDYLYEQQLNEQLTPEQMKSIGAGYSNLISAMTYYKVLKSKPDENVPFKTFTNFVNNYITKFVSDLKKLKYDDFVYTILGGNGSTKIRPKNVKIEKKRITIKKFLEELKGITGELGLRYDIFSQKGGYGAESQWDFQLQTTKSEVGNGLWRIHFTRGIPPCLRGAGLGKKFYLGFIHHSGNATSSSNASASAQTVWSAILSDPKISDIYRFSVKTSSGYILVISKKVNNTKAKVLDVINKFLKAKSTRGYQNFDEFLDGIDWKLDALDPNLRTLFGDIFDNRERAIANRARQRAEDEATRQRTLQDLKGAVERSFAKPPQEAMRALAVSDLFEWLGKIREYLHEFLHLDVGNTNVMNQQIRTKHMVGHLFGKSALLNIAHFTPSMPSVNNARLESFDGSPGDFGIMQMKASSVVWFQPEIKQQIEQYYIQGWGYRDVSFDNTFRFGADATNTADMTVDANPPTPTGNTQRTPTGRIQTVRPSRGQGAMRIRQYIFDGKGVDETRNYMRNHTLAQIFRAFGNWYREEFPGETVPARQSLRSVLVAQGLYRQT